MHYKSQKDQRLKNLQHNFSSLVLIVGLQRATVKHNLTQQEPIDKIDMHIVIRFFKHCQIYTTISYVMRSQ